MRSGLGALEAWSCSLAQREIVPQFVDMVKIAMRFQLLMYSVAGIYTGELHPTWGDVSLKGARSLPVAYTFCGEVEKSAQFGSYFDLATY